MNWLKPTFCMLYALSETMKIAMPSANASVNIVFLITLFRSWAICNVFQNAALFIFWITPWKTNWFKYVLVDIGETICWRNRNIIAHLMLCVAALPLEV